MLWREYAADRGAVPPGNLVEISYAELTADPVATLRRIYATLGLSQFEKLQPKLEATLGGRLKGYVSNKFASLPPETMSLLARRWGEYAEAWGYELRDPL